MSFEAGVRHCGADHTQNCRWHIYPSIRCLQERAALAVLRNANRSIAERGAFHIVLAGGNTPKAVYRNLCDMETQWAAWHVYFGDERCVAPDDSARNSKMAAEVWLDYVPIPRSQIHPIPAEGGGKAAAQAYSEVLRPIDLFDLVLLGLGEDGHTASLFPGQDWGEHADSPAVIAVHDAPKPPPDRVSLSAHRLGLARQVVFLVSGVSKHQAVLDWVGGKPIPAASIFPPYGIDVLLERACMIGNDE